jgi:tripartite-type tricarboxylate transporter receptor subunit TctC
VENRSGAAGTIAGRHVATSAPDGYTLLIDSVSIAQNATLYRNAGFSAANDLVPVAQLVELPFIVAVNKQTPARTIPELVALAKARPGALSYGSAGNGTAGHLAMEMIKAQAGIDMVHVPYRGSPPVLADLMGGRIAVAFDNVLSSAPGIAAGRLRALAVSAARRAPALPDVPTIAESGLAGFDVTVWQGALFPAGTDPAIVARLGAEMGQAMQAPDLRARLSELGAEAIGGTPAAFAAFLQNELAVWGEAVRRTGARLD